ncbi:MAG TPA: hypothetical protein PK878_14335 [bacterium]|nr:hypothetical protein [bacterium]
MDGIKLLRFAFLAGWMGLAAVGICTAEEPRAEEIGVELRDTFPVQFPASTDCNSPAHWDDETFYLFNSAGHPSRSSGPDLFGLGKATPAHYNNTMDGGRWIEATHRDNNGTLYGWYHNEPTAGYPQNKENQARLTAPRIGALRSLDNGMTWEDLGIILQAPADSQNRETENFYFTGGNGDFSVLPDRDGLFVYFFISTYNKDIAEQGVAVARMRYADRDNPVGKVWKWHKGAWNEPGLGGHVTPIFHAFTDWHRKDADAFWGPSIHWNTFLEQYVILLNRAKDWKWSQEGIYITFNPDLSDPEGWSPPRKIMDGGKWYPQVIGIDTRQKETDKQAGQTARFFMAGESRWEIVFTKPGT